MSQATIPARPAREPLPKPIRQALGRLDRRLRLVAAARGIGLAALVAVLIAAVGMAADFAWPLPQPARWAIWVGWLAAIGLTLLARVGWPLVRRVGSIDLAAVAERSDPQLGERMTGAVGLLGEASTTHGSPVLIAALANEAASRAGAIDPARAISSRAANRWLAAALLALGLIAVPAAFWPRSYGQLAQRFLVPWADLDRVGRFLIDVAPGDRVVALGSDLTISAAVRPRFGHAAAPGEAWLEWTDAGDGTPHRVAMPAESEAEAESSPTRAFSVTLPKLNGSLTYRIVSGSAQTRRFRIEAIEPPAVASLAVEIEPPAYTRYEARQGTFTLPSLPIKWREPSRIEAWEGSRIRLNITASRPVEAVEVEWPTTEVKASEKGPGSSRVAATRKGDSTTASATLDAVVSGTYSISLRDSHGLTNRPEPPRRLIVRPDAPPVVVVQDLGKLKESSPDDVLRIAVATRDDIAVASVELHYTIERGASSSAAGKPETGHVAVPLAGLGTKAAKGAAELALKSLDLKPGDTLLSRVRVADNRPAPRGPNVVWSPVQSLAIVARSETLLARQKRAERESLQAKLDALKKDAAENRKEAEQLRYAADAVHRGNGQWDKQRQQTLADREREARGVADRLQLLARELEDNVQLHPLARPARQIAEVEAEGGRAMLDQARRDDDAERRLNDLRQADTRLAAVSNRLDELQRQFDALARRDDNVERLRDLAAREDDLADRAADQARDRAQLDRLQAEQNAVQKDLDALLQKSPELRADMLAAQAEEAKALAQRAHKLAERQRDEARRATDMHPHAAALKALADEQRAIEDDARRLALQVDEPLAENGRGRLNTDAVRQPAEAIERGDVDQARQQLEGAEGELRRLARDLEDVPGDPRALANRLLRRQDALNGQVAEVVAPVRSKTELAPDEKAALTAGLKPLAERQAAIAKLAEQIAAPKAQEENAKLAEKATARAAEGLRDAAQPREITQRQNEARAALSRLANAVPDTYQRQRPTRQQFEEARRLANEVNRDLDRHLNETAPRRGRPSDPAKAAADLARRLEPLAQKQAKVAEILNRMDVEPRVEPQRNRAADRADTLAKAIEAVGQHAAEPSKQPPLREALPALRNDARAALDRLDQKLNGQVPADDLAAALAEEQRALEQRLAKPPANQPAAEAGEQRRLATALRNLNVPDAPLAQAEAVRLADRAAKALADPNHAPQEAAREAAEAVEALANRLANRQPPRAEAAALARAERALNDPMNEANADPARAAERQRAIAGELARLPLDDKAPAREAVNRAAELTERALQPGATPAGEKPTPAAVADARAKAAEALDALAGKPAEVPPQPDAPVQAAKPGPADPDLNLDPKQAGEANALARRERQLRERLQSILGEHVAPQQDLRRETAALGRELADLRDRARPISPRSQGPAHEAAANLGEHAPRAMDQGAEQLAQGQPAAARETQRRAAEIAERGAQQAEDLAAALRADRPMDAPAQGEAPPSPLADARQELGQASRQLDQARDPAQAATAGQAAQQAMRSAARDLQAAAQHAADAQSQGQDANAQEGLAQQSPPSEANPQPTTGEPQSTKAGKAEADLADLKEQIRRKTGRAWGELPGHLRTEILQMSQGRYRDDYARLIQLYFREIAAGAAESPGRRTP